MGFALGLGKPFSAELEELHRPDCEGKISYRAAITGRRLGWVWRMEFRS
jgi:hypothetical protein